MAVRPLEGLGLDEHTRLRSRNWVLDLNYQQEVKICVGLLKQSRTHEWRYATPHEHVSHVDGLPTYVSQRIQSALQLV